MNRWFDRWVPPVLRDSRALAWMVRRSYGPLPVDIVEFKDRAFDLSRRDYARFYRALRSRVDQGPTDLTPESLDAVLAAVDGDTVLDVACGLGDLAARLARAGRTVVGADVAVRAGRRGAADGVAWVEADVEQLPFRDRAFDVVVSTHTLEHVQHLAATLAELRRVARRRLVVVVPRQRPYRVTFNPHVHFFPYRFSVLAWTGAEHPYRLDVVGGDWLYVEERPGA
jgi:ubiquinone/menaquinone biosynthesis C-methylase UbiE